MLDSVIGFSKAKAKLEALDIANLRSCVIFYGKEHSGKFTLARALADSITTVPENVHVVSLQEKKTQISIEQIRTMLDEIKLLPYNGDKRRVVIIDEAQTLNNVSENAILKLLEEPPEHVMVILVVNDISKLLPTIRSRCYAIQILHTKEEMDKVYSESSIPKDILDFVREVYQDQIGIVFKLDSPEYQETIQTQKAIIQSLTQITTRAVLSKLQEQFAKVNTFETLRLAMIYYAIPEHKSQNPDLLKIIYTHLQDANRGLNDKLIVDSLIGRLVSSNKKCYGNNNTNS